MLWLKSFLRSSASRGAILCAVAAFKGHEIDEVHGHCTACGASKENILDNVARTCVPDGKPHQYTSFPYDRVAA